MAAALWWFFKSAEVALYLIIIIDFLGLLPTLHKTYKRPWTEGRIPWSIATAASLLNVVAIENWTPAISIYPIYVALTNSLIVAFIILPRYSQEQSVLDA